MVSSSAVTVAEYLKSLPAQRRAIISTVRKVIRAHLPKGYREGMNWGMICYEIPLKQYPNTYNGQPLCYAALAAQKHYNAVYLAIYEDLQLRKWFKGEFAKAGKKLDMGKCCVRFRKLEDLDLDAIGEVIGHLPPDEYIAQYEATRGKSDKKPTKKPLRKTARR